MFKEIIIIDTQQIPPNNNFNFVMPGVTTLCYASIILSQAIYNLYLRLYKNRTKIIIVDAGYNLSGEEKNIISSG